MLASGAPDNVTVSSEADIKPEKRWARLDQYAQECLGISGADFLDRWLNGRIRMIMLEDPDYVPWLERPRVVSDSAFDDSNVEVPPVVEVTEEEWRAMFDRRVRRELGISGEEFVRKFNAGEYPDWDPELASLVFLIPTLDY